MYSWQDDDDGGNGEIIRSSVRALHTDTQARKQDRRHPDHRPCACTHTQRKDDCRSSTQKEENKKQKRAALGEIIRASSKPSHSPPQTPPSERERSDSFKPRSVRASIGIVDLNTQKDTHTHTHTRTSQFPSAVFFL